MKTNSKKYDTILEKTLENARQLNLSDKKLVDMMKGDRTEEKGISTSQSETGESAGGVRALYKGMSQNMLRPRCEYHDKMPYHPLPNAVVYGIPKESFK